MKRVLVPVLCAVAAFPMSARAQDTQADEVRLMREATLQEAAGDLARAERVLIGILEIRPESAPALLALERVLRHQARLEHLPPLVERALEEEPGSAILNQLLLRTYSGLDRVAELEAAVAAWTDASPGLEAPYREAARTWQGRGDFQRARAALEMGRDRVAAPDALALELGALYAALDQPGLAAREWDRAIGGDGAGVSQVRRQLRALPDGGAAVLPELVARLERGAGSHGRTAAGLDLALAAGFEDRALELARRLVSATAPAERRTLLLDLARRADGARLVGLAHYAYGELLATGEFEGAAAVRARFAELSLAVGDTAAAAMAYGDLGADRGAGSVEQRKAAALQVELLASHDAEAAARALRAFRDEHRNAAETDRLAAAVAGSLERDGRLEAAEAAMAGVRGPRTALVRGRIALLAGERDAARTAYMAAAPELRGAEATHAISLVTLLTRIPEAGAAMLGQALADAAAGEPGRGVDRLVSSSAGLASAERAALLEFAASLAEEHGLDDDATRIRQIIVAEHPRTSEAPAALLALARAAADRGGEEARELLERLIIEYPRSALVPQARRDLEQIRRATASSNRSSGG
jgi:hypothetical protein